jgi:AcrR family transcriptional regulator
MKNLGIRRQPPENPRRSPQQWRAQRTVEAIRFAASHILRSEGDAAVTTERVARAAGVSIGSLYQYFANKQAIVADVRARHGEWLAAETRAGIERGAGQPTLREAVRASIEHMAALQRFDSPLHGTPAMPLPSRRPSSQRSARTQSGSSARTRRSCDRWTRHSRPS